MPYTNEQILTLASDRHLAVTANAGSGKTTALVNKYVNLLLEDPEHNPYNILAITFTRKAAAEMKSRVISQIEKMLENPDEKRIGQDELYKLRLKLSGAQISTIHSFCSSLLKDYPIEAGLIPNFVELSEVDKKRIKDTSIQKAIEHFLINDKIPEIEELFNKLQLNKIKPLLSELFSKRETLVELKEFYKIDREQFFDRVRYEYLTCGYYSELYEVCLNCSIDDKIKAQGKYELNIVELLDEYQKAYENLLKRESGNKNESLQVLKLGYKLSLLRNGRSICLNKLLANRIEGKISEEIKVQMEKGDFLDERLFDYSQLLLKVFEKALEFEREEKEKTGGIDFDDMILLTAEKLLNEKIIVDELRNKFQHVLVDEFQDTNKPQYKIIGSLIRAFNGEQKNGNKLFIVGDDKQSIYGFRGADVRVFKEAKREIIKANTKARGLASAIQTSDGSGYFRTDDEKFGDIKLLESFRMLPNPAAFINSFCRNLFNDITNEYDTNYEELIVARDTEKLQKEIEQLDISKAIKLDKKEFGSVSILANYTQGKNGNNYEEEAEEQSVLYDLNEAALVAAHIKESVSKYNLKWEEIAVLSRTTTKFKPLAAAFQEAGIPYIITAGKGFYETQETKDIVAFLKFLYNEEDDLSLAEVLLSPYFSLNETELFDIIANSEDKLILWKKVKDYALNPPGDTKVDIRKIKYAYDSLDSLCKIALKIPIVTLINQILQIGGFFGWAADAPARLQIDANIKKILDAAIDFESKGFKNLHDFVEELNILSDNSAESEAVQISAENAVKVLTIHASKGLEWDMVYIYNLNSKHRSDSDPTLTSNYGFTYKLPDDNPLNEVSPRSHILNKNFRKLINEAEEKRLLYVAMTRARKHLVMSANFVHKVNSKGELTITQHSNFKLFKKGLDFNVEAFLEPKNNRKEIQISYNLKWNNLAELEKTANIQTLPMIVDIEVVTKMHKDIDIAPEDINQIFQKPDINIDAPSSSISGIKISASRYMAFKTDKVRYLLKYKYGVKHDLEKMLQGYGFDDKVFASSGLLEGNVTHYIMSEFVKWRNSSDIASDLDEQWLKAILNEEPALVADIKERVISSCRNLVCLPIIKVAEDEKIKTELAFTMPFYEDYLNGAMDLVIEGVDSAEVIDWKTNSVANKEEMVEESKPYLCQMHFYLYLISCIYPDKKKYSARLIFTKQADPEKDLDDYSVTVEWTREDVDKFKLELKQDIEEMKRLLL